MGLAAAQLCINRSGNISPDAIIVGTGLGCLQNLEQFLKEMLNNREHITSVLPFINSTHNAVASQIAMLLKNHNENFTFCHRSFSFENALQDALMHLAEDPNKNVLVGGIDECTDDYMQIYQYLNYWKEPSDLNLLLGSNTCGTVAGEGAAFFMLSGQEKNDQKVWLRGVTTFSIHGKPEEGLISAEILKFLGDYQLEKGQLDLVLLGINGDKGFDEIYHRLSDSFFDAGSGLASYKNLCGEYYTAASFAFWLASTILSRQSVPAKLIMKPVPKKRITNVLIYNHLRNTDHSLMLLSSEV
jgi:3-oxoacyl-(acyl-carrier-protein) synthase